MNQYGGEENQAKDERYTNLALSASLVHTPWIHGLWKHVFRPRVLGMKSQVISQSWLGIRIIGTKPIWRWRKSSKRWEIYKSSFISFIGAYTPNSWPVKTCFQTVSTRDEITVLHAGVFLKWSWRLMDHWLAWEFFSILISVGERKSDLISSLSWIRCFQTKSTTDENKQKIRTAD